MGGVCACGASGSGVVAKLVELLEASSSWAWPFGQAHKIIVSSVRTDIASWGRGVEGRDILG